LLHPSRRGQEQDHGSGQTSGWITHVHRHLRLLEKGEPWFVGDGSGCCRL
jgi:hypothetical protein